MAVRKQYSGRNKSCQDSECSTEEAVDVSSQTAPKLGIFRRQLFGKSFPSSSAQALEADISFKLKGGIQRSEGLGVPPKCSPRRSKTSLKVSGYAGRLGKYITEWKKITEDPWVLSVVKGYRVQF